MAKNTLRNTQVTWRGGMLLTIFFFVGVVVGMDLTFGDKEFTYFTEWAVLVGGMLSSLLIGFRIRLAADGFERIQILKKVGIGVVLMAAAGIATVISHDHLSWVEDNARWFIVPTGLYLSGMALIANAMNPQHEQWSQTPRRSRMAIPNKKPSAKASASSQPRKWGRSPKSAARPIPVPDELPFDQLPIEELAAEQPAAVMPSPAPRNSVPLAKAFPPPPMPTLPHVPLPRRPNRNA